MNCNRTGCTARAEFHVKKIVLALGDRERRFEATVNLPLCADHVAEIEADPTTLVGDEAWNYLVPVMRIVLHGEPDRSTLRCERVAIIASSFTQTQGNA